MVQPVSARQAQALIAQGDLEIADVQAAAPSILERSYMTRLLIPVLTLVFALGLAVLGGPGRSSSDDRPSPPSAGGVDPILAGKLP